MLTFLLAVEAKPGNKLLWDPDDPPVAGYFQTLGVTAADETELLSFIVEHLRNDLESELIAVSERWEPDFDGADHDIRELIEDTTKPGVWYFSGRAFYAADEE